jgi:hypothetical protein
MGCGPIDRGWAIGMSGRGPGDQQTDHFAPFVHAPKKQSHRLLAGLSVVLTSKCKSRCHFFAFTMI